MKHPRTLDTLDDVLKEFAVLMQGMHVPREEIYIEMCDKNFNPVLFKIHEIHWEDGSMRIIPDYPGWILERQ